MAKVHLVNGAVTHAVRFEPEGVTPIVPQRAVVLQFPAAQATDEWPIPPAPLSLAVSPETAIHLALALYEAATEARKEP